MASPWAPAPTPSLRPTLRQACQIHPSLVLGDHLPLLQQEQEEQPLFPPKSPLPGEPLKSKRRRARIKNAVVRAPVLPLSPLLHLPLPLLPILPPLPPPLPPTITTTTNPASPAAAAPPLPAAPPAATWAAPAPSAVPAALTAAVAATPTAAAAVATAHTPAPAPVPVLGLLLPPPLSTLSSPGGTLPRPPVNSSGASGSLLLVSSS